MCCSHFFYHFGTRSVGSTLMKRRTLRKALTLHARREYDDEIDTRNRYRVLNDLAHYWQYI